MKTNRRLIMSIIIVGLVLFTFNTYFSSFSTDLKFVKNDKHEISDVTEQAGNIRESRTGAEGLTNYSLDLVLDSISHYLSGTLILDYVNQEDITMDKLYFHLFPNASVNEDIPGYLLVNAVKTKDQTQDLDFTFGNQLLNLTLPQPLLPNEEFSLWMDFETAITSNESFRLNYKDDSEMGLVYALCNYYPILAVFDDDGWNLEPQYFIGDPFYSDVANYYVNLTVPSDFEVASSGELMGQSPEVSNQIEYKYELIEARDFSFAISPDYILESGVFNSIPVNVYYLPRDAGNWSNFALNVALYSLDLFTDLYGPYPYNSFAIATTFGNYGGMEWPGIVYIQSGYVWFETGIAHEIAHQWFYAVVGNDQIDEGFMDEGIVCYSHWYYFEERYEYTEAFSDAHLWRTAETSNDTQYPEGLVINRSINYIIENDLDSGYYWEAAYHKTPSVLHMLRTYIGDENFFNGLKRFYSQYSFRIATFNNLIESFNYYINIDWFLPWFNEGFIPEIEVVSAQLENIAVSGYNLSITLKQTGNSVYSTKVPFIISLSSGADTVVWVWSNTSIASSSHILLDKKPLSLTADLSSGYLYSLNLLEMDPFSISDNRHESSKTDDTDTSASWLIVTPVIITLVLIVIGTKRRKI
ncbi:MAG: M1 family metallopeptidase [Candidatus Hodarchaeales archaeon]